MLKTENIEEELTDLKRQMEELKEIMKNPDLSLQEYKEHTRKYGRLNNKIRYREDEDFKLHNLIKNKNRYEAKRLFRYDKKKEIEEIKTVMTC
jgi:hypothetical protein